MKTASYTIYVAKLPKIATLPGCIALKDPDNLRAWPGSDLLYQAFYAGHSTITESERKGRVVPGRQAGMAFVPTSSLGNWASIESKPQSRLWHRLLNHRNRDFSRFRRASSLNA